MRRKVLFLAIMVLTGCTGRQPAAEEIAEEAPQARRAKLVFAGDLMQHMPQVNAARTDDGFDYRPSFGYVRERFLGADLAVVNLETTLSPSGRYTGYPCFCSPAEIAGALADMGVDIAVLANNHCCDRGSRGIGSTIEALDREGIGHTGAFADSSDYERNNILRFELNDIRFALVNYTYGTNGLPIPRDRIVHTIDTVHIAQDLSVARRDSADCIIAAVHWGNEYERHQNGEQKTLAAFLRRHGVDLIVGSHPHVIQPFEADSSGITLYSLGNFVSNQRGRYCDGGAIASIDVEKLPDGAMRYGLDITPVWVLCPGYYVVPPEVGDTLPMTAAARAAYERFMDDTRKLLYGDDLSK